MDEEFTSVIKKKWSKHLSPQPTNIQELWISYIQKDPWGIVYKVYEDHEVKNYMMYLQDGHYYKSATLIEILAEAEMCKVNSKSNIKCV